MEHWKKYPFAVSRSVVVVISFCELDAHSIYTRPQLIETYRTFLPISALSSLGSHRMPHRTLQYVLPSLRERNSTKYFCRVSKHLLLLLRCYSSFSRCPQGHCHCHPSRCPILQFHTSLSPHAKLLPPPKTKALLYSKPLDLEMPWSRLSPTKLPAAREGGADQSGSFFFFCQGH